jgi:hypothetical protein
VEGIEIMPGPDAKDITQQNVNIPHELLRQIGERKPNPSTEPDLAFEISELRKEIAMLRAELKPVQGLIVTGQNVLDEFKRITGKVD